ncbi:MAG: T9SS type A sorting domain-containing protein [Cytophagaceae bacterium]|nr:MAG: T9SS type A sorting domain-containing protein [Cytophagaceae bacterium]
MKQLLLSALPLAGLLAAPALGQSVTFATAVSYASGGTGTSGVAVQDLNGDGKLDIILSNTSSTVGVLLNTGTGSFPATATTYASGATAGNASTVALGDVNADGKTDLVVLNTNDSTVGVLLGTGTGTFQAATTYPAASYSYPSGLALADVNSDGRADILVANNSTNSVGVLLSRSAGGFSAAVQYTISGGIQSITAGDLNGDSKPDIIFGASGGSVGVLLNSGTGTFPGSPTSYPTGGSSVQRVKVGDVNNDGKLDVATANTFENTVSILLGTGTGTLGTAASYSAGSNSGLTSVALGDLNKDGRLDVVSANYSINSAGVLLGQSAGGFPATATLFSTGNNSAPNDVVIADINGDSKPDLITANSTTARVAVLMNTSVLATKSAFTAASVALYPNPAHGSFLVQVPGVAGATTVLAELRTALGQRVLQQAAALPLAGTTLTLPTADLAAGVYLLQLQAGDNILTQRVVVE